MTKLPAGIAEVVASGLRLMHHRWAMGSRVPMAFAFAATALVSSASRAQTPDSADALFARGVELMKTRDYAQACPQLARSLRLAPTPGGYFTLAECHRLNQEPVAAVVNYSAYLRAVDALEPGERSREADRSRIARSQREGLLAHVAQVRLRLPGNAPADTRVSEVGGGEFAPQQLDTWLPMTPGMHTFVVQTARGKRAVRVDLEAGTREAVPLELPASPSSKRPAKHEGAPRSRTHEGRTSGESAGKSNTLAWISLGVGGAGLVTSAAFGVLALSKKSSIDDNCGLGGRATACNADGKAAADSAQTYALVGTIGFAVGVVGIGTGTTLLLTSGDEPSRSARVGLRGSW
ncbi:MAG: tetratricopeptide repeat protein [Polyangiaceae bacterium]